ncbi:MAG: 2-phospho-L-lactate guanylyltransferase [Anaerolineae bacterium]
MSLYCLIPAKPFDQAKTRLSPLLSRAERAALSRLLLQRTVRLARTVGEVVVVSRSNRTRRAAKAAGAWTLIEAGTGLNPALRQARAWALAQGAEAILVLPGDLPLLSAADLRAITQAGRGAPAVVIAPCRREEGSNALLLRPPHLIDFHFGPGSFRRHLAAARRRGIEPAIYRAPNLALDLDLPTDLRRYRAITPPGKAVV